MIKLDDLSKFYGKQPALQQVNLEIAPNEITGIVGPNGTGKTTLIKLIVLLLHPTSSQISRSIDLTDISVASEEFGFPPYYTVRKVVRTFSLIRGCDRQESAEILEKLGLSGYMNKRVSKLSQGLKQRLNIACAIMGTPKLIILDEPNNGLDPDGFKVLRSLISDLKDKGVTIILASHLLYEVERLCDRVILMKNGRILLNRSTDDLLSQHTSLENAYDFYSG